MRRNDLPGSMESMERGAKKRQRQSAQVLKEQGMWEDQWAQEAGQRGRLACRSCARDVSSFNRHHSGALLPSTLGQ
jgi:hypothetical protein